MTRRGQEGAAAASHRQLGRQRELRRDEELAEGLAAGAARRPVGHGGRVSVAAAVGTGSGSCMPLRRGGRRG